MGNLEVHPFMSLPHRTLELFVEPRFLRKSMPMALWNRSIGRHAAKKASASSSFPPEVTEGLSRGDTFPLQGKPAPDNFIFSSLRRFFAGESVTIGLSTVDCHFSSASSQSIETLSLFVLGKKKGNPDHENLQVLTKVRFMGVRP